MYGAQPSRSAMKTVRRRDRLFGGTTEIQKEIIGRSLGL
jgi:hypothetical protein